MSQVEGQKLDKQGIRDDLHAYRESHVRRRKNKYRLTFVKMYRFVFDIVLFYLAWTWFRYGRFFDLPARGFRYNYFVTIGYAVILYWFKLYSFLLGLILINQKIFINLII